MIKQLFVIKYSRYEYHIAASNIENAISIFRDIVGYGWEITSVENVGTVFIGK